MGNRIGINRFSVGKPEGKKPLGWVSHRREYNIQMNIQEVGWRHGLD
jgi:hypothetical protein